MEVTTQEIKITRTKNSKLASLDFNNIPFGKIFSDHMFYADYIDGEWVNPQIVPLDEMLLHPGNMALHYGQTLFEGMKASKSKNGKPLLLRPEKHLERLNASARRLCMVEVPEEIFMEGLKALLKVDVDWIPPMAGSALYLRPFLFAFDHTLGVKPSESYRFMILTCPVGPYYSAPIKLKADAHYVRAVVGGVGEAKAAGNYAASLMPANIAREEGCDQVMWLDGVHHKFVQEVGTMNIFFVIGDDIVTPKTDGAILKGITRDSIITLLRADGYNVVERLINIDEIFLAHKTGRLKEIFGSGTAAVVNEVNEVSYLDQKIVLHPETFKIAKYVKDTINNLRVQDVEDRFNWLVEVE
jgi:branched-chain amino acid aminotransferase